MKYFLTFLIAITAVLAIARAFERQAEYQRREKLYFECRQELSREECLKIFD